MPSPLPALVVLFLTGIASPAVAAAGGTYAGWIGTADAGNAMVVTTDPSGSHVRSVAVAFDADCGDGRYFAFHRRLVVRRGEGPVLRPVRNAGGRFVARYEGRSASAGLDFLASGVVRGRFRRHTARGTLRMTIDVVDRNTSERATDCVSRHMAWHLQRGRGRVYGGTTTQGEPVALTLSADRATVEELAFGWHGSCASGDGVDIPGYVTGLPLLGRVFADYRMLTDGLGASLGYDVSGRLRPGTAWGALSVALVTAAGDTCLTGALHWRARSG